MNPYSDATGLVHDRPDYRRSEGRGVGMTEQEAHDEAHRLTKTALVNEARSVNPFGPDYSRMTREELEKLHVNLLRLSGKIL